MGIASSTGLKSAASGLRPPAYSLQPTVSSAFARFEELGFPTTQDEDWRFTPVTSLANIAFKTASFEYAPDPAKFADLFQEIGVNQGDNGLNFVNGQYVASQKASVWPKGVVVRSLAAVLDEHPEWVEPHLTRYAKYHDHAFTALNTAFLRDGAFVHIPRNTVVEEPIYLTFVAATEGGPLAAHPRVLIVAEENSQATIVESYLGREGDVYFHNAVTEIVLGENAVVDHYKIQRESTEAFHIATMQVRQERDSNFTSHSLAFGGALARNEVTSVLNAEGCECTLNGLYLANGRQLIDNHTCIDHAQPHCASHELYKGILAGQAKGVFNGKIVVRPDAQKTDARQTNKTLLLSDDAVIHTKPQLEIFADDVKCSHGAAIGRLDEEALFYLRSRGLGVDEARSLLIFAFANDIISRIQVEPLRKRMEKLLREF